MNFILFLLVLVGLLMAPGIVYAGGGGGKKKAPKAPPVQALPEPEPLPDITPVEAESSTVRDDERRKLRRRKGAAGTVLAPLGKLGTGGGQAGPGLLGHMG